ncbi:MAG: hemerythrin domain-containing protein [Nitrososphaerota archaeon]|jgi:iron-sulfur cluster repair protein YtfE (RIC family)|nr:hemerythrin domain-containing protein [Nitrososphaerota archaeon]
MSDLQAPSSLEEEHRELFRELVELESEGGETGKAVKELLAVLEPHFEKEESVVMPLLGALRPLSDGKPIRNPSEAMSLYKRLSSDYPKMLKEHAQVKKLIESVRMAAAKVEKGRALTVMDGLEHHAKVEEEVLYPAAMLVGAFAKGKAKAKVR